MTFATFDNAEVLDAVRLLAGADKLAVLVGAGVSAEAGLPNWPLLVERLLTEASKGVPDFLHDEQRTAWVERTMRTELPPGAAGIAQSLLKDDLPRVLKRELYRAPGSNKSMSSRAFSPGPTAHAVAALRVAWDAAGPRNVMKIFTTNYDDFLERAIGDRQDVNAKVVPWYWPNPKSKLPPDRIKVHHLHGYLVGGRPAGTLTLTDTSYLDRGNAIKRRDEEVRGILNSHRCLFLGSSFSDPNVLRYIHEYARDRRSLADESDDGDVDTPQHVALFTHHSDDPPEVLKIRQSIVNARMETAFTKCVFLDYYADVSQFVYEVRNCITQDTYVPHGTRAKRILRPILQRVIYVNSRRRFDAAQPLLNSKLSSILKSAVSGVDRVAGTRLRDESLALGLWLLDDSGTLLTPWVTTDRVHRDPALIQTIGLNPRSRWLAAKAVCEGKWLAEPRSSAESRWPFIVGLPLLVNDRLDGRVSIGALTMTTLNGAEHTCLSTLDARSRQLLSDRLTDQVGAWLLAASQA